MKKSVGTAFIVIGALFLLFAFGVKINVTTLLIGIILIIIGIVQLKKSNDATKQSQIDYINHQSVFTKTYSPDPPKPVVKNDDPLVEDGLYVHKFSYDPFSRVEKNSILKYTYETSIFLDGNQASTFLNKNGTRIQFKSEPDNQYDNKAVAIYDNEENKIGYVYRGRTQDMINDWLKRGDHFKAYITSINVIDNKIQYKIGFYRPLELYDYKVFPLIKLSKKDYEDKYRYDNLLGFRVGDYVEIEEDCDGNYVAYASGYMEIGELSKAASEFISDYSKNDFICTIYDIDYSDDKTKCKICLYLL